MNEQAAIDATGRTIRFTVFGKPQQKGSKRAFAYRDKAGNVRAGLNDDNARSRQWQGAVSDIAAANHAGAPLTGPVELACVFFFPRPKSHFRSGKNARLLKADAPQAYHAQTPDLSKLTRTLEDGMNGIVYADDKQVARLRVEKRWTEGKARVEVCVSEIKERP